MQRRAVFLDRDGVLNISHVVLGKPYAPRNLEDFILVDGADIQLRKLQSAGFFLIVVTNQPDVGNGIVEKEVVEAMHARLKESLPVDDIEVCYASQEEGSIRRKPEPGMILDAAEKWNIDLTTSFLIGDRWSDIEASRRAGCVSIYIDHGYWEPRPDRPDYVAKSLAGSVEYILERETKNL